MRATYDIDTKVLIIIGEEIETFVSVIEEMGEWNTLYGLNKEPLYDIQLDFDDSIDKTSKNTELNPDNYNLQYCNLNRLPSGDYEMGNKWDNIELLIFKSIPFIKVIGQTK